MKLTVAVLLLVAASQAVDLRESSRQKNADSNTEKRGLTEGNANVDKRAPALPTAASPSSPGIEYADTKESHADRSPSQQIYSTSFPQIAKISDVLTGQGPPFQAAIASHLYSPISVYQQRLGAPRTYEISTPIASQLAYSEHKISYQPPQNAIQYNEPLQYNQKLPSLKQPNFVRPINFQQPYQQQLFVQPQPVVYSQQPQLVPGSQPIYQQLPQIPFQIQRPFQYVQNHVPQQQIVQQPAHTKQQQNLVQVFPSPGITYAREEVTAQTNEQPAQQQSNSQENRAELTIAEKPTSAPQQNFNAQSQGPVSYASFSQGQPVPSFAQSPIHVQDQPQYEAQPFHRAAPQLQLQPQQLQFVQPQLQPLPQQQFQHQQLQQQQQFEQQQLQPQIHYQLPPQIQYQIPQNEPSKLSQESLSTAATKSLPNIPGKQLSYFRPGPSFPLQSQLIQPQPYQQNSLPPHPGHGTQSSLSLVPSFPPVQYFGKFAQSIFGGYHQQ